MEETSEELWKEATRTAKLLRQLEPTLESMEAAVAGTLPLDKVKLPVDYVSDAMILATIILRLEARGARVV